MASFLMMLSFGVSYTLHLLYSLHLIPYVIIILEILNPMQNCVSLLCIFSYSHTFLDNNLLEMHALEIHTLIFVSWKMIPVKLGPWTGMMTSEK